MSLEISAVLLAGGASRRMGRDKALVPFEGWPLWERQVALLRTLGPREVFVSGPRREEFPADLRCVADDSVTARRGPLAGVAAALREARAPLVLVVAVDLPGLSQEFLRAGLARCSAGVGAVPFLREDGRVLPEPLAAVYPLAARPLAESRLAGEDWSMRGFVRACAAAGLVTEWEIPPDLRPAVRNVNTPEELAAANGQ